MSKKGFSVGDPVQVYGQGPIGVIVGGRKKHHWTERASRRTLSHDTFEVFIDGRVAPMAEFILNRPGEDWPVVVASKENAE